MAIMISQKYLQQINNALFVVVVVHTYTLIYLFVLCCVTDDQNSST